MTRRLCLAVATVVCSGVFVGMAASATPPLPRLAAATVVGDRVTLTFTGALQPRRGAWTVIVNGVPTTVVRAAISGRRAQLVLPRPLFSDDTIRVVGRFLRSARGARLSIVDSKPMNRSPAGCTDELGRIMPGQATEGPTDTAMFLPLGRPKVFVVNVDYADARSFGTVARLDSLDFWVRSLSYGRAGIDQIVYPTVIRMPKGYRDYVRTGGWPARKTFFQDVVLRLDPEIDFRDVDALVVLTTRASGAISSESGVIAPSGSGLFADGRELRHFGELSSRFGAPGASLEMMLTLAGVPSLARALFGDWDPAASTNELTRLGMLAWHRRKLGWLDPTQTRCLRAGSIDVTLTPTWSAGGLKMIVVPLSATSAVVLENRQPVGLDAGHCSRGVLAYQLTTAPVIVPAFLLPWVPPTPADPCGYQSRAPHDFQRGDSRRIGAFSFEVLEVGADGSYRLRVSR